MEPITMSTIITRRWQEAIASPTMARWNSLSDMCGDLWMTVQNTCPTSPMLDDLRVLADLAHQHMLDMQPVRIAA